MSKKNKGLKSVLYDKSPFFTQKELDIFYRMIILCIKFRISDNISINQMRMLYAKMKELS